MSSEPSEETLSVTAMKTHLVRPLIESLELMPQGSEGQEGMLLVPTEETACG